MVKRVKHPARDKLVRTVKNLGKANAQVGYFKEQGKHSSGFSYPALMYLQEVIGVPSSSGKVNRRLFEITMMLNQRALIEQAKKNLIKQFRALEEDPTSTLEVFAKGVQKAIKSNFGNSSILPPNSPVTVKMKGFNSPLIETGELKDNLAYKVSTKKGINK